MEFEGNLVLRMGRGGIDDTELASHIDPNGCSEQAF